MQMLPELAAEFESRHSAEDIRDCADAILARFDDAPVRSFAHTLALRKTRECLHKETCDALAMS